jgi:hypothetical protein
LTVELLSLSLKYIYEGLIEGSREGAIYVLKREIEQALKANSALFVIGFSEPDEAIDARWAEKRKWPPHEEITVRLQSNWVPEGRKSDGKTVLTIRWYQDGGDPFAYLALMLRKIDWKKYSAYEDFVD